MVDNDIERDLLRGQKTGTVEIKFITIKLINSHPLQQKIYILLQNQFTYKVAIKLICKNKITTT